MWNSSTVSFQEELSRLRRKLEKQKKVEVYTDADEILQEEINQYKVKTGFLEHIFYGDNQSKFHTQHLLIFILGSLRFFFF